MFHRLLRRDQLCPGGPAACSDAADGARCEACPEALFDSWMSGPAGLAVRNVVDLDFALQVRMPVPWDAVNFYEFLLLRILTEERNRLQDELMEKARQGSGRP